MSNMKLFVLMILATLCWTGDSLNLTMFVVDEQKFLGDNISYAAVLEPRENVVCLIHLGDNKCAIVLDELAFIVAESETEWGAFGDIQYTQVGSFTMDIECDSTGTRVSDSVSVDIIETLKNVVISQPDNKPLQLELVNGEVRGSLNFSFEMGSFVEGEVVTEKGLVAGAVHVDTNTNTGSVIFYQSNFSSFGRHSFSLSVYNIRSNRNEFIVAHRSNEFEYEFEVMYDERITGVRIEGPDTTIYNTYIDMIALNSTGSRMNFTWECISSHPCWDKQHGSAITCSFEQQGQYNITLLVENELGQMSVSKLIQVFSPVHGFNALIQRPYPRRRNLVLQSSQSTITQMGQLYVTIYDRNLKVIRTKIEIPAFANEFVLLSNIPGDSNTFTVKVFSDLSTQNLTVEVNEEIVVPVPTFAIHNDMLITLPDGVAEFTFSLLSNDPLELTTLCTADFDDSSEQEIIVMSEMVRTGISHTFKRSGICNVSVVCKEEIISSFNFSLIEVKRFKATDFRFDWPEVLSRNYSEQSTQVTIRISLFGLEKIPPDVTMRWDFGDGEIIADVLDKWAMVHTFSSRGHFNITVKLSTQVGDFHTSVLPVRIGILELEVSPRHGIANTDMFKLSIMGSFGETVNGIVYFDDKTNYSYVRHTMSSTDVVDVWKQYETSGVYVPRVLCWSTDFVEQVMLPFQLTVDDSILNISLYIYPVITYPSGLANLSLVLTSNSTMTTYSQLWCHIDFHDGSTPEFLEVEPFIDNTFTFNHTFLLVGLVTVDGNCSTDNESYVYFANQTNVISNCFGQSRPFSNLDRFIQTRISERVVLAAKPQIQCTGKTPEFIWRIEHNANRIEFRQPKSTLLVLPPRSMKAGVYKVIFYATFSDIPTLFISDNILIVYEESPLQVNIKGGNYKMFGRSNPIVLDAITDSYDPDMNREDNQEFSFSWKCRRYDSESEAYKGLGYLDLDTNLPCIGSDIPPVGILAFIPECLQLYKYHVFQVTIKKGNRSATNYQIVYISGDPLQVDLRCKVNCLDKIDAEFSFSLESECIDCSTFDRATARYSWALVESSGVDSPRQNQRSLDGITSTGTNISSISIRRNSLMPGMLYIIELTVWRGNNRSTQRLGYSFRVNFPPYNGSCFLFPAEGIAVYDRFQASCTGWVDEGYRLHRSQADSDDLLTYDFMMTVGNKTSMLFSGGNRRTPWQEFNPGLPEDDYLVTVTVKVFDRHKGVAEVNLTARVTPPLEAINGSVSDEALSLTLSNFETKMNLSVLGGDIHEITRTVEATSSVLNQMELSNTSIVLESTDAMLHSISSGVPIRTKYKSSWKTVWDNINARETEQQQKTVTKTTSTFAHQLHAFVNLTKPASLSAVHMLCTSASALVNPTTNDHDKLESVSDVLSVASESLEAAVDTEMSDVQVTETLSSVVNSVGNTMAQILKEKSEENWIDSRREAVEALERQETYSDKDRSEGEQQETSGLRKEERVFLLTRLTLLKQYKVKKQAELAKSKVAQLLSSVDKTLHVVSEFIVEGQVPAVFTAPQITASTEKNLLKRFLDVKTVLKDATIQISAKNTNENDNLRQFTLQTIHHERNPYVWNTDLSSSMISSPTVQVNLAESDSHDSILTSGLKITYKVDILNPSRVPMSSIAPEYIPLDWDQMLYHRTELKSIHDDIIINLKPAGNDIGYDVYFRSGIFPTSDKYDFRTSLLFKKETALTKKSARCPAGSLPMAGTIFIGIKPRILEMNISRAEIQGISEYSSMERLNSSKLLQEPYDFGISTVGCQQWDDLLDLWNHDFCKISDMESDTETQCVCEESARKSLTMGTTFYVPVNTIDFSTVFTKIDIINNSSVLGVVCVLIIVYIILSVWAKRCDKRDALKWGVTCLFDNKPRDTYHYLLTVHTGMRIGAGTESRVGFIIAGDSGDTNIRVMSDGVREGLERQSIVYFMMAVPSCLGDLQYIRIWHDNSGHGSRASWFLHKVIVEDLQLNKKFVFYCGKWLALDRDDGRVDRLLPVAGNQDRHFRKLLYNNTRKNVSDKHLWFSVLLRPQSSYFTRFQRLSSCLCLLFLTMISNALFFHPEANIVRPSAINIGLLRFSTHQLYVSVIGLLIVTPVSALIIWLFSKSRPRWESKKPNQKSLLDCFPGCCSSKLEEDQARLSDIIVAKGIESPTVLTLPHICVYIAWTLLILSTVSSGFFLVLYSQQWGAAKSEEWLTSFLLSFFESLLVLDPIKVIIFSVVVSLFVRKADNNSSDGLGSEIKANNAQTDKQSSDEPVLPEEHGPLPEDHLQSLRVNARKETKAFYVFNEILLYSIFLLVIYTLGFSNRDHRSFMTKNNIYNMMVYKQNDRRPGFVNVKTHTDYFHWMNVTVFPALFHEAYADGSRRSIWDTYYLRDLQSFRVGAPRLRQIRGAQLSVCERRKIPVALCNTEYLLHNGEDRDFCLGWSEPPCPEDERVTKLSSSAWNYTSPTEVWAMPVFGRYNTYLGGGYIAELGVNKDVSTAILAELISELWVDRQTRALTLEFTTYNPNSNMFCYVSLLAEFPETGGMMKQNLVAPFRVYQHVGALGSYIIVNEILFLIFLVVAIFHFFSKLKTVGFAYLNERWHLLDFVYIISSIIVVAMYFVRHVMTKRTIAYLHADPGQFINFNHIVVWDEVMVIFIGIISLIVTLRMLSILGYSRRVSAITRVLTNAGTELFYFSIIFFIVFIAFVILGLLLFGTELEAYHSFLLTSTTLMNSMIGKTPFDEMRRAEPLLAQFYFVMFVFFVVLVLLTMFLAILNDSIAVVKASDKEDSAQQEMLLLLLDKLLESLSLFFPGLSRLRQERTDGQTLQPSQTQSKPEDNGVQEHKEMLNKITNKVEVRRKRIARKGRVSAM